MDWPRPAGHSDREGPRGSGCGTFGKHGERGRDARKVRRAVGLSRPFFSRTHPVNTSRGDFLGEFTKR